MPVGTTAELQAALAGALCGDDIVLADGVTYVGKFNPPNLACGGGRLRAATLPPAFQRVTAADSARMPKLLTGSITEALGVLNGAHDWYFAGFKIGIAASVPATTNVYSIVLLGTFGTGQTSLAQQPRNISFDRMIVDGGGHTMQRCVSLNAANSSVTNSLILNCYSGQYDAQAIGVFNTTGPLLIENNQLRGSGENILIGGTDPTIPGIISSDVTIRRNWIEMPYTASTYIRKNLMETKCAVRVLIESNVLEGSWRPPANNGQTGQSIVIKGVNQNGGGRQCLSAHITVTHNLVRNAGEGIGFIGAEVTSGTDYPEDSLSHDILVSENVFEQINIAPWSTTLPRLVAFNNKATNVTMRKNVMVTSGFVNNMVQVNPAGFVNLRMQDNCMTLGQYGLFGSAVGEGLPALGPTMGTGWTWTGMTLIGPQRSNYPPGTTFVTSEAGCPFAAATRAAVTAATQGVVQP